MLLGTVSYRKIVVRFPLHEPWAGMKTHERRANPLASQTPRICSSGIERSLKSLQFVSRWYPSIYYMSVKLNKWKLKNVQFLI